MAPEIGTVGVVGLGTMGAGIAEVLAREGLTVVGLENSPEQAAAGAERIRSSTDRAVRRGKLSGAEQQALLQRITVISDYLGLAEADLVVEAVPEQMDVKREVFRRLEQACGAQTILATNTSSLSVTEIAVATADPSRVVGLHFFNPAPVQRFVEVIRTVVTDESVVRSVARLAERLGKTPVVVGDKAGFIANALLFGYLNHAVSMYESHFASREDLDTAMQLGCGLPMGPLALMDLIGLDTAYEILDTMYKQGRNRLHAPTPMIKAMVTAGLLGRKTGRGFYNYAEPGSSQLVPDPGTPADGAPPAPVREVARVGVVGSGTMATGIAEVFAKAGFDVVVVARTAAKGEAVRAGIGRSLEKAMQRGKLDQADRDQALGRVIASCRLEDLADADLVIEAVLEDLEVKAALFENLDQICKLGAVLATSTSSLPVIDCAVASGRPRDVVGLHFFNPAPVMKLVEVVHTVSTAPEVVATALDVCRRLGKSAISCADRAGFVVNALLFPYLNDAVRMLEANYASADDIDTAMKAGCGYPMGPFELLDVVGLDVALAIERSLYLEFREPGFAPAPLLEHLVTAGYHGRKTGRGFRIYR